MSAIVFLRLIFFFIILIFLAILLGEYMAKVFSGKKTFLSSIFQPLETLLYKFFGINEKKEMNWKSYALNLMIFNIIGILFLFLLQTLQGFLPLNPQKMKGVRWDTAINTAVSFVTNTNWQAYGGESTMSYLTQMLCMTVQNFLSAATGIAAAIAFIRGFSRKEIDKIGNFWQDLTRTIIYVLLPLSIVFAIFLASQGVVQNFKPYVQVKTIEGGEQVIAQGPSASQVAIKLLGTNGGGFFNTNSAHPYENPTPLSDFFQIISFLIISVGLTLSFGILLKNRKRGLVIFTAMLIIFLLGLGAGIYAEFSPNPNLEKIGVLKGVNMEGKDVRFGVLSSILFGVSTTSTSCGAVNSMHDSMMPLTGFVFLFNMMAGEVIFGGVGTGLISMLLFAMLAMFLVGLMIGRTPELYGKKLEPFEMVMAVSAIIFPSIIQLAFGSISVSVDAGISSLNNHGPHNLSEILYAFASGAGNNGSAFAGLNANTPFYNLLLAVTMFVGRFVVIIPSLAIAGSLACKRIVPESSRFPTETLIFVLMLVFVVIIVGALTFFPVLVLGPFLEHLLLKMGRLF